MSFGLQLQAPFSSPNFLIVAAVVLVIIAHACQAWYEQRKRVSEGRAPRVPYIIPWAGSALDIWRDPDAFFTRTQRKYGDVFVVKAFGRDLTYAASPSLISEIYRNPQKYDFDCLLTAISTGNFKLSKSLVESGIVFGIVHTTQHRNLSPLAAVPIVKSYITNVWELLEKECPRLGVSTPLFDFIHPTFYKASVYSVFGTSHPVTESYEPWCDFIGTLYLSLAGLPQFLLRGHLKALSTSHGLLEKYFDGPHDDASELVLENERTMRSHGFGSKAIAPYFFITFFALVTNAPVAAYWLIVFNLQREGGLMSLTSEVDEAIASWKRQHPGQNIEDHLHEAVSAADLPLLTSTIRETLRYTTSIASIRRVTGPVEFGGYRLNAGDEVACLTRSVHLDEEVHESASEYDPRRYMTGKRFSKNGKAVTNHTMPWGGGVSMCPGRYLANMELKAFMFLLLMRYTLEIDPRSAERPKFRLEQVGIGIMDPRGDLRVILRARE